MLRKVRKEKIRTRFEEYYPFLCRIAYGYIPHMPECEDIVQDAFIAVWHNGKDDLPDKEFIAYMVRAVKNNCISFLRKRKPEVFSLQDGKMPQQLYDLPDEPEQQMEQRLQCMQQILKVLPPKCCQIFLLSKRDGLKYREIASKLNISEKTVENQMGKAMRLIRDRQKEFLNHPCHE